MLALFDAHSHLAGPDSPPPCHSRVVCGTCEGDWSGVLAEATGSEWVIPMLGLHPWFVSKASEDWQQQLEALLRNHSAGVGECGLDFALKGADRVAQEAAFRHQLRLAHRLQRPIAIHAVRAWGALLAILHEEGVPPAGAMVHAFSGSLETAEALQNLGVFLSFSGGLLRPDRLKSRQVLRAVKAPRLLLETDGAFDLAQVLAAAAALRGESEKELATQTWENGQRCFNSTKGGRHEVVFPQ
jgi:TatD DNase family protein